MFYLGALEESQDAKGRVSPHHGEHQIHRQASGNFEHEGLQMHTSETHSMSHNLHTFSHVFARWCW